MPPSPSPSLPFPSFHEINEPDANEGTLKITFCGHAYEPGVSLIGSCKDFWLRFHSEHTVVSELGVSKITKNICVTRSPKSCLAGLIQLQKAEQTRGTQAL